MLFIRNATLADLPYIYDICAKSALDGDDARDFMSDDCKVGHYFAAPYLQYDLSGCFVLVDNLIPVGFLLGTINTVKYTQWLNRNWLPHVQMLYSKEAYAISSFDEFLNSIIHAPTKLDPRLEEYPAHFHIDILNRYRHAGWGRKLIQMFKYYCKTEGVNKLHLLVSSTNVRALQFYEHLGFKELFQVANEVAVGVDFK